MNSAESRIKEAAYKLINDRPFKDVTAEQIISEAHVAKASFYYYFKDKYDVATTVFKDRILTPLADPEYKDFRWKARICQIYKRLTEQKKFVVNLMDSDKLRPTFVYLTRYYCSMLSHYIRNFAVDVDTVEFHKAIQNASENDMMVVYYYCKNRISDEQLIKLARAWAETSPHVLYRYIR